jgi:hypothetical protein
MIKEQDYDTLLDKAKLKSLNDEKYRLEKILQESIEDFEKLDKNSSDEIEIIKCLSLVNHIEDTNEQLKRIKNNIKEFSFKKVENPLQIELEHLKLEKNIYSEEYDKIRRKLWDSRLKTITSHDELAFHRSLGTRSIEINDLLREIENKIKYIKHELDKKNYTLSQYQNSSRQKESFVIDDDEYLMFFHDEKPSSSSLSRFEEEQKQLYLLLTNPEKKLNSSSSISNPRSTFESLDSPRRLAAIKRIQEMIDKKDEMFRNLSNSRYNKKK